MIDLKMKIFSIFTIILVIFNKNIYAEEFLIDDLSNEEKQNIEQNLEQNLINENLNEDIEYKIYNKNNITSNNCVIKGNVKNCSLIKVRVKEQVFVEKIDNDYDKWNEFCIEISTEDLLEEMTNIDIEFSNKFNITKKENLKVKNNDIKLLSNITNETKEIKIKCNKSIKTMYALIDSIEYKGNLSNIEENVFTIILPKLNSKTEIVFIGKDKNGNKVEKIETVKQIKQSNSNKNENKNKNEFINNFKSNKNTLNLKIIELNNKSSKIKGETLPESKIYIDINGIVYETISDKKGYFEIDLFIKRKAQTKVTFKIINFNKDSAENEKTFIEYVQDKIAPKKPYVIGNIRESDIYLRGKTEAYANIIINIKGPTHIVKEKNIDVRQKPSLIGFNKIGRLLKGVNVLVIEEKNGWSKIEYKDSIAYIKSKEIEEIDSIKEYNYNGKADCFGDYKIKIGEHKQGSRIRVRAKDKSGNLSKKTITTIQE